MKSNRSLWILAFLITISSAIYQRSTGPTYPVKGNNKIEDIQYKYKFERTHGGTSDHEVSVTVEGNLTGKLLYKRYKIDEPWTEIQMSGENDVLKGSLPNQPPAGKLMYKVILSNATENITLPENEPVIIRFKGAVPLFILIPHVIFMFAAMFVSTRAGIEAILNLKQLRLLTFWTAGLLFLGGMILGPVVQEYAFGDFWTGFPFGHDLTDNKTLIAMIGWIVAVIACIKENKNTRYWVLSASIILMLIYLIPHSMFGSELDYSAIQ
ncbi:hypothetical protein ACFL5P_03605 [candidate division KSB1 bacterium]